MRLRLVGRVPGSEHGDVVALARQLVAQRSHEVAAEVAGEAGVVVGEDGDAHSEAEELSIVNCELSIVNAEPECLR